jgi:hypothetical protein
VIRTLALLIAVSMAGAQAPRVGDISFYGLHKVTPERILSALQLKTGGSLPPSKGDMEDSLEKIPGVVFGRVEAVCCDGGQVALFIGIVEKGEQLPGFHSEPAGSATLPADLMDTYRQFLDAVGQAAHRGSTAEDLSAGHSLMADPGARAIQKQFASFAAEHLDVLRDVLKNGAEGPERAVAAAVIGYAPKKQDVIGDLQYATQDPDESVRVNAMRSQNAIAVLAAKQPGMGLKIPPTWFVELLSSIVLSDRVEAAKTLLTLTDGKDPSAIALIRERGLPSLAEMARWQTPRYALPPFLLLGRVAGIPDAQVQRDWEKGARETVISKALGVDARKR